MKVRVVLEVEVADDERRPVNDVRSWLMYNLNGRYADSYTIVSACSNPADSEPVVAPSAADR